MWSREFYAEQFNIPRLMQQIVLIIYIIILIMLLPEYVSNIWSKGRDNIKHE